MPSRRFEALLEAATINAAINAKVLHALLAEVSEQGRGRSRSRRRRASLRPRESKSPEHRRRSCRVADLHPRSDAPGEMRQRRSRSEEKAMHERHARDAEYVRTIDERFQKLVADALHALRGKDEE